MSQMQIPVTSRGRSGRPLSPPRVRTITHSRTKRLPMTPRGEKNIDIHRTSKPCFRPPPPRVFSPPGKKNRNCRTAKMLFFLLLVFSFVTFSGCWFLFPVCFFQSHHAPKREGDEPERESKIGPEKNGAEPSWAGGGKNWGVSPGDGAGGCLSPTRLPAAVSKESRPSVG